MTKGIENTLGLRSLEEALAAFGAPSSDIPSQTDEDDLDDPFTYDDEDEDELSDFGVPANIDERVDNLLRDEERKALATKMLSGKETEDELTKIQKKLLNHAETMADLAMELDPGRAPRAFEVANALIKSAMDAVEAKREYQLKVIKLMQDQQKIDLEYRKLADKNAAATPQPIGEVGSEITGEATVIAANTADMLRKFQNELKSQYPEPPPQGDISSGTAPQPK